MTIDGTPPKTPGEPPATSRQGRLAEAVRDELLSWNPREFISVFRRWHHGSFSLIHLNVLTMLDTDGPDSMSHLADALDVSVASMTGIVDRMERRGLVERRHEDRDRRVVLVYPTEAGRDVFREIDQRRREGLGRLLDRLSADELDGLLKGHRALRQARAEATAARSAEAAAARSADTTGVTEADASTPTTPPALHPHSTIRGEDPLVQPATGSGR